MLEHFSGATRVVLILGDPIAQVKAPAGLTREFERRGHDAIVVPLQLAAADVVAGIAALTPAKNVDGLIATIPHKFALAARCATLSERAKFLGVVNVARRNADGSWHGDMLDGEGFAEPLAKAGCEIKGNRALLVGAGGAGSAIALALLDRGVAQLTVHDVDAARRDALIAKRESKFPGRVVPGACAAPLPGGRQRWPRPRTGWGRMRTTRCRPAAAGSEHTPVSAGRSPSRR